MPDDVSIGGTLNMTTQQRRFPRLRGGGATNVSAKLNFDIPGLKEFKTNLEQITKSLDTMNTTFTKLAKAPEAFSKSLEGVVKQMKALQAAQIQANKYVSTAGAPPQQSPVGQATAAASGASPGNSGGAGSGAGLGGAGGPVGQFFQKTTEALLKRFDAGMQQTIASDVYVSRMAAYAGGSSPRTPAGIFRQEGKKGFGFMATDLTQANEVLYQGTAIGAYYGASGRAGQAADAYTTSIKQQQITSPGLDAMQGASQQTAIYNNIQGIKLGRMMFGASVSPYKQNGDRKTQNDYFRDVLNALQKLPRPNGQNGAWTKDDLMRMNFPGSRLNNYLASILPQEVIPEWYDWAITNAAVTAAGQGPLSSDPKVAKKQKEAAGMGRSLATNAQETTNREAQKDATFAGEQYGTMNARLDYEKDMLGALQHIDSGLSPLYAMLGRAPSMLQGVLGAGAGLVGGVFGSLLSVFGGDPGYMPKGDPGYASIGDPEGSTSHLTPDLRKRVNAMMAANPGLVISSAFRDTRRQDALQKSGAPAAPAGKSKHGRGQAVDFANGHGWIAKNARKFGLEPATRYGEPWHVQLAGTLNIGDPIDPTAAARKAEEKQADQVQSMMNAYIRSQGTDTSAAASTGSSSAAPSNYTPGQTGALSADQMVRLLHDAGFQGEDIIKMAGISHRESSWNPQAHNPNVNTGDDSYGLWQINMLGGLAQARMPLIQAAGGQSAQDLLNPEVSAKVLYQMWSKSGYSPWGPYKGVSELNGVKQEWLDEARVAAQSAGYLGDVGYAAPPSGGGGGGTTTVNGGTSVTFQNTFSLSFPNGASKQSIDTAVKQIAQRLEPQMRRMVARNT